VVASYASKLASTASRIFRLVALAIIASRFLWSLSESQPRHYTAHSDFSPMETVMSVNRNILFLIIGALILGVGVLGYNLYQTKKQPEGLQINVGPSGLKIQNK
jgi:hypothetical protein